MQILFERLKELQQQIEKNYANLEYLLEPYDADSFEQAMEKDDSVYKEYYELIKNNFTEDVLMKVDSKIGHGRFIEPIYLITLQEIAESERGKTLAIYNGYTLRKDTDPFGYETYFIYDRHGQWREESFDFTDDESVVSDFYNMVDNDSFNI